MLRMNHVAVRAARTLLLPTLALLVLPSCFSSGLRLRNQSGSELVPYPVVTDPPPPHRVADPGNAVPHNSATALDPQGFNPVFYTGGITDDSKANTLQLQFALDQEPYSILARTLHSHVAPDQETNDPSLQPILLHEVFAEIENRDYRIIVSSLPTLSDPLPPGGWRVTIEKR